MTTTRKGPGDGTSVDDDPPGSDREPSSLGQDQVMTKDDESGIDGHPQTFRLCLK